MLRVTTACVRPRKCACCAIVLLSHVDHRSRNLFVFPGNTFPPLAPQFMAWLFSFSMLHTVHWRLFTSAHLNEVLLVTPMIAHVLLTRHASLRAVTWMPHVSLIVSVLNGVVAQRFMYRLPVMVCILSVAATVSHWGAA